MSCSLASIWILSCGYIDVSSRQQLAMLRMHLLTVEELAFTVMRWLKSEG